MIKSSQAGMQLSGKLAGNTYSINKGTQLMRATPRTVKRDPSASQKARRTAFSILLHRYWQAILSDGFRSEWETYAKNHPTTNRLGERIYLTGRASFIKININRQIAAEPILLQPVDLNYI